MEKELVGIKERKRMRKTIVIHSGGLDSTVLLASLVTDGDEVKALSVDYGQRHRRELEHAKEICGFYGVEHEIANLSLVKHLLAGSSQTSDDVAVPHGHYAAENMKQTVVPNRNAIMLSLACGWAISLKYDAVAYAAHAGDHAVYPDCREEFIVPFTRAMENADWHRVTITRPFLKWTKKQIVELGDSLDVPFKMTYSCYQGKVDHCALCGTCQERRAAFRDAGVKDPTEYDPEGLKQLPDDKLES
jgi:7-cyano-7-deazaguanine synthase